MQIRKRMNRSVLVLGLLSLLLIGCGKKGSRTFPSIEVMKNDVIGMYRINSGDTQFIMEITGDDKINFYTEDISGKSKNLGTYTVAWNPKKGSLLMKGDVLEKELFVLENGAIQNEENIYERIEDDDTESMLDKDESMVSVPEKNEDSESVSEQVKDSKESMEEKAGSISADNSTDNEVDDANELDEAVTMNHNEVAHSGTLYIEPRNDYTISDPRFNEMGDDFADNMELFFERFIPWFNSVDITSGLPIDFVNDEVNYIGNYIIEKYYDPNQAIIKGGDYHNAVAKRKIALCHPFIMAYGMLCHIALNSPVHISVHGTIDLNNPDNHTGERTDSIDISLDDWKELYNEMKEALLFYYEGAPVEEYYQQYFNE